MRHLGMPSSSLSGHPSRSAASPGIPPDHQPGIEVCLVSPLGVIDVVHQGLRLRGFNFGLSFYSARVGLWLCGGKHRW